MKLKSIDQEDSNLPVIPCTESSYFDKERIVEEVGEAYFETLYCLDSYNDYTLQYPDSFRDAENSSI